MQEAERVLATCAWQKGAEDWLSDGGERGHIAQGLKWTSHAPCSLCLCCKSANTQRHHSSPWACVEPVTGLPWRPSTRGPAWAQPGSSVASKHPPELPGNHTHIPKHSQCFCVKGTQRGGQSPAQSFSSSRQRGTPRNPETANTPTGGPRREPMVNRRRQKEGQRPGAPAPAVGSLHPGCPLRGSSQCWEAGRCTSLSRKPCQPMGGRRDRAGEGFRLRAIRPSLLFLSSGPFPALPGAGLEKRGHSSRDLGTCVEVRLLDSWCPCCVTRSSSPGSALCEDASPPSTTAHLSWPAGEAEQVIASACTQ